LESSGLKRPSEAVIQSILAKDLFAGGHSEIEILREYAQDDGTFHESWVWSNPLDDLRSHASESRFHLGFIIL
jgi:hypothetical protein